MLGHIQPPLCRLGTPARNRYRQLYCSMCYSLRQQFGLPASLLISHELTLGLVAATDGLAVPVESCACPAQLFCGQRPMIRHATVDHAARLNLVLVWLKLVDWESDGRRTYMRWLRQALEGRIKPILAELSPSAREFIAEYIALIKTPTPEFSAIRSYSGELAERLFVEFSPDASPNIGQIVNLVGEIIPIADALLDLQRDIDKQHYNPIITAAEQAHIPLEQAYQDLYRDYRDLLAKVMNMLVTTEHPTLTETLTESFARLSTKIDDTQPGRSPRKSRRRMERAAEEGWCNRCCGWCGDCCDCALNFADCASEGCPTCGRATTGTHEGCCACGDCSCCNCSCN